MGYYAILDKKVEICYDDIFKSEKHLENKKISKEDNKMKNNTQGDEMSSKWEIKDGVIYTTLLLDQEVETQMARLENLGFKISNKAREILRNDPIPILMAMEYKIAILKGSDWNTVEKEAEKRGFTKAHHQLAPFIREKISDQDLKEMDLSFLVIPDRIESDTPTQPYALTLKIGPNKYGSFIEPVPCYPNWPCNTWFVYVSGLDLMPKFKNKCD